MTKSGIIIGAVIAACVAVAVGLLVWYLFWFRRRRWRRQKQARSSILTQGPAQAEPEDGIHITASADLPHEHLTPFVVNPESGGQAPSRSLDLTTHRGTSSSSHESSDSKGTTRSSSTSSEETKRSLKSSGPPTSSDSHLPASPRPTSAETRRPLRLHVASLPSPATPNMGTKTVLGASRRPVKLLPMTPVRPLRGESVGHAHVIQEEDGGEVNETTTMAYRVPPAYSQIPPRHSTL